MSREHDFDWLARNYTTMFIFGCSVEEQVEFFEERNKYFVMKDDIPKDVVNNRLISCGFDPDSDDINLNEVHYTVFKRNRGRFETEKSAVEADLRFWYKELDKD